MNEDLEDKALAEAVAKAIELLAEHMDSGIIIGSVCNDGFSTQKWARPWGNSFAVSKMVECQMRESQVVDAEHLHEYGDD